jgi:hypothetical protein
VEIWLGSWIVVVFDKDLLFGIFILCNLILWGVLEQSTIIAKAIRGLIKILGSKNID